MDFSSWQPRRMVLTKQLLVLARSSDDEVVDVVQLHEVKSIKDHSAQAQIGQMRVTPETENGVNSEWVHSKKTFQIETSEDGYNAGRMYTIQVKSEVDFKHVVADLIRLSTIAREKAEARSKFKKKQDQVSKVFNSNPVQGFFALLIFAVKNIIGMFRVFRTPFCCSLNVEIASLTEFHSKCF